MIVVCGATGQQGGAVIDALLASSMKPIRGLSRDVASRKSQALVARDIEMVKADLADADSLAIAFKGARAAFAVTQPWSSDYKNASPKAEVEQGKAIIEAARRTGIEHLVLTTVVLDGVHRKTGVPHVDSKVEIEIALSKSNVPWTVLGPGTFMDNIGTRFFPVGHKSIRGFVSRQTSLPYVATRDIGRAAARIFADPSVHVGKRHNLIAGMWDGDALCAALSKVYGRPYRWKAPPRLLMRLLAPEFYKMRLGFEAFGRPPFPATFVESIETTRKFLPDVWSIEDYVREKRPGPGK